MIQRGILGGAYILENIMITQTGKQTFYSNPTFHILFTCKENSRGISKKRESESGMVLVSAYNLTTCEAAAGGSQFIAQSRQFNKISSPKIKKGLKM